MHGVNEIIQEASAMSIEARVKIVDSLLHTLYDPDSETDKAWINLANTRLHDLRSGKVRPVAGADVFAKIRERFER